MLQIIQRLFYVAIVEFVELAIVYHRTRQLERTANEIDGRIRESRNYRQADDMRWN